MVFELSRLTSDAVRYRESDVFATTSSHSALRASINSFDIPSILRGVPHGALLRGLGSLLKSPPQGSQFHQLGGSSYAASQEVPKIDWFISHSWRDDGWKKYIALLWLLNRRAALCCANVVALVWAIATATARAPRVAIDVCMSPQIKQIYGFSFVVFAMVFVLVLCWNPFLFFGRDIIFFLDKACIHQTDAALKEAGITRLGAFLKYSKRMLVLWSSDYFSRLWCNYELATFVSLHGVEAIEFMPLFLPIAGVCVIILGCACQGVFILLHICTPTCDVGSEIRKEAVSQLLVWSFGYFVMIRAWRMRNLLTVQTRAFSLASSKCFCCDIDHILEDGKRIACDREFVRGNVNKWFAELADPSIDGVVFFEHFVHDVLTKQVRYLIGPLGVPLSNVLHIACLQIYFNIDMVWETEDDAFENYELWLLGNTIALYLNHVCLFVVFLQSLARANFCASGRIAVDVALGALCASYSSIYMCWTFFVTAISCNDEAYAFATVILVLNYAAAWMSYKLAWHQGNRFASATIACHILTPFVLGIYYVRRPRPSSAWELWL